MYDDDDLDVDLITQRKEKVDKNAQNFVDGFVIPKINNLISKDELSKENLKAFFTDIVDELEKQKFISSDHKEDYLRSYKSSLSELEKDLSNVSNTNHSVDLKYKNFSLKDKLVYGVSKICQKLSCNRLSKMFRKLISKDNLTKLETVEKNIMNSLSSVTTALSIKKMNDGNENTAKGLRNITK